MSLAGVTLARYLSVSETIRPRYTAVDQSPAKLAVRRYLCSGKKSTNH